MTLLRFSTLLLVIVTLFMSGCGKDSNGPSAPPPIPDSLGTGWTKVTLPDLFDIFFVDNKTGYAGGSKGLYKSTDGGINWTPITLPANKISIFNIFFLDANHGWLIGHDSIGYAVLRTMDGGSSFKKSKLSSSPSGSSPDIQFLNSRLGYAVADDQLYMSSDSGNTWTATASKLSMEGHTLLFQDSSKGWVATYDKLLLTTNGGKSFTVQQSFAQGSNALGIQFPDPNTGWVACQGGVYKTTNAGVNWELMPVAGTGVDAHFFNADQGFLLQMDGVYKTTNGGKDFTKVVKVPTPGLLEIQFTDSKHGWVVSENGFILRYVEP